MKYIKNNIHYKAILFFLFCITQAYSQKYESVIEPLPDEKWWGGMVGLGSHMPFEKDMRIFDLGKENRNNQNVPFMLSSAGRYIWSDNAFSFKMNDGKLYLYSDFEKPEPVYSGSNLREAYMAAMKKHFPPSGDLPDSLFFSVPQYNTWIELMYNQNQKDILKYADNIIEHEFPVGVFMVDDNWQKYYGNFEFKPERFSDPKGMVRRLHSQGFKIMLWVCPFVSPDSPEFRSLQKKGFLIKRKGTNNAAIIPWWNGYSACYDMSNPKAVAHLKDELYRLQKDFGVDGFKFDAGDISHYTNPELEFFDKNATPNDMCEYWAKLGLSFPFNEFRAGWKMGGEALVQRLGDKNYSWNAIGLLIPEMLSAGLLGYAYTCPDLIGGGQYASFLEIDQEQFDQELIVRSTQIHAMMPMMQFSVAPWRILNKENLEICRKYALLHRDLGKYILQVAKESSETGEPIVRHMEYVFPHQGFLDCKDQFMLGSKYMVTPMVEPGNKRSVRLPKGKWKDELGKRYKGPRTIKIDVPLERLPFFEKLEDF